MEIERIIQLHRLHAQVERRMHKLIRCIVTGDQSPETYQQYVNAYAHMLTVRKIRSGDHGND